MHIKANMDDCALVIDEFLPKDLFKKIKDYNYKTENKHGSYSNWKKFLFKDSQQNTTMKKVNVQEDIVVCEKGKIKSKHEIFKSFFNILIDCPFIPYQKNSWINLSYYEYNKFSGINWHDDGKYTLNYSFYIHDTWDKNWGGETLIDTGRGLPLACYPNPNTLLVVKNKIRHKVCPVMGPIKRKVLQIRGIFYE
jgi:Rps23 Pro-64 3,4-dihydroxylase Tpa1-like proline 4-hydroxylase|tara:strand:- start:321 stop:902 length:582 start_codon:yes stop_codon:yes gene_type:complete